jgi:hypothetical protein
MTAEERAELEAKYGCKIKERAPITHQLRANSISTLSPLGYTVCGVRVYADNTRLCKESEAATCECCLAGRSYSKVKTWQHRLAKKHLKEGENA